MPLVGLRGFQVDKFVNRPLAGRLNGPGANQFHPIARRRASYGSSGESASLPANKSTDGLRLPAGGLENDTRRHSPPRLTRWVGSRRGQTLNGRHHRPSFGPQAVLLCAKVVMRRSATKLGRILKSEG
jgi:hypothetical protein